MTVARVLVCGGRDKRSLEDRVLVWQVLDRVRPATVISGGAPGIDTFAAEWARSVGAMSIVFYAQWDVYGRAAGPIRNGRMLKEGAPSLVIAFPGGRGTANMVKQARAAGVQVLVVSAPYAIAKL